MFDSINGGVAFSDICLISWLWKEYGNGFARKVQINSKKKTQAMYQE